MAIKNLTKILDQITCIPRPKRSVVSKLLKEVYDQGVQHNEKKIGNKVHLMYNKYLKLQGKYLH